MELNASLSLVRPELILSFSALALLLLAAWREQAGRLISILSVGALVAAAAAGETGRLLKIIAAGARASTPGALHAAARRGEAGAPAAALLLLNGADPLAADAEGLTPADAAAAAGAALDGPLVTLLRNAANKAQA